MKASPNVQRVSGSDQVAALILPSSSTAPGILSHFPGLFFFGLMMAGYQLVASVSLRGMASGTTDTQVGGALTLISHRLGGGRQCRPPGGHALRAHRRPRDPAWRWEP